MDNIREQLVRAIELRKPISYDYEAEDRAIGLRYGNPHAIFIATTNNINIDIWKTGGVRSDTKPLPAWRQYKIQNIKKVTILEGEEQFTIAQGYNPNSKQYSRPIAKV